MKINYYNSAIIALTLFNCGSVNHKSNGYQSNYVVIKANESEDSSKFIENTTRKVQQLLTEKKYTPFETLQVQKLDRIEKNSEVSVNTSNTLSLKTKTGNEIYYHLKERTLFIGSSYLCDKCPNIHLNSATGFVIHEDGVIVTNYHVIDIKEKIKTIAIFAADHEGNVYPVSEILSTSKSNDIAILQLDMQGEKLKPLELAEEELMGQDVFVMGHPFNNTFFMSKGIVARKYLNRQSMPKIAVTADFGQGASGGPVVNNYGQIVGIVSTTYTHYTTGSKTTGNLQMVVKEVVPVSVLNNYIVKGKI